MSATDVPCPVCGAPRDENCRGGQGVLHGKPHKARVKLARQVRHKMTPPWKPGGRG